MMQPNQNNREAHFKQLIQDLMNAVVNLARSELKLMRTEVKATMREASRDFTWAAIFGGFALLGVMPFVAFIIIGLGKLMNDQYWLSALITSIFFTLVGTILAFRMVAKLKKQDLSLPMTRQSVQEQADFLRSKIRSMAPPKKNEPLTQKEMISSADEHWRQAS